MKKLLLTSIIGTLIAVGLYAQSGPTPAPQLRVETDAQGFLAATAQTVTLPLSNPTPFNQIRLMTDANNYLMVALDAFIPDFPILAPTSSDCSAPPYSFAGRTTTGLASLAASTWSLCGGGTLGLEGNTANVLSHLPFLFDGGSILDGENSNILELYNGANGQEFYIYYTKTDASNYSRLELGYDLDSDSFEFGTYANGSGAAKNIAFITNGFGRFFIDTTGNFKASADNQYDIGASGNTRPRTGYFGTSIFVGLSGLVAEDSNWIFHRNGTNAQRLSVANTYTSATNYEAFSIDWQTVSNVALVGTRTAATGSNRVLSIGSQSAFDADEFVSARFNRSAAPLIDLGVFTGAGNNTTVGNDGTMIRLGTFTSNLTSGSFNMVGITPTYNQSSGTAANTDLLVNRTETAVGSGSQRLLDLQVGSTSRLYILNTGVIEGPGAYTGTGVEYACFEADGTLVRQNAACGT